MSRKILPFPRSTPAPSSLSRLQLQRPSPTAAPVPTNGPLLTPHAILRYQQTAGNRATLQRLGIQDRPPVLSVPQNTVLQRIPFRYKSDEAAKRGERLTPQALMAQVGPKHPIFKELLQAPDAALTLTVNYAGGKDHGDTVVLHDKGITFFRVTLYWKAEESFEDVVTTLLHEVMLHVLPQWQLHLKTKELGTLSEATFPDLEEVPHKEQETREHMNLDMWVEAVNTAKRINSSRR